MCASVISGDFTRSYGEAMAAKQSLKKTVEEEKVKGFVDILVARNVIDGLSHLYVLSSVFVPKTSNAIFNKNLLFTIIIIITIRSNVNHCELFQVYVKSDTKESAFYFWNDLCKQHECFL